MRFRKEQGQTVYRQRKYRKTTKKVPIPLSWYIVIREKHWNWIFLVQNVPLNSHEDEKNKNFWQVAWR